MNLLDVRHSYYDMSENVIVWIKKKTVIMELHFKL